MKRSTLLFCLFSFASMAQAQWVPIVDDAPKATQVLDATSFDFIASTLQSSKLADHMDCELKVTQGKEVRKFSTGTQWVEYLDITYRTNAAGGGHRMNMKFPMTSKFGKKVRPNIYSGLAEDFKLEAGDSSGHWMRFIHDGKRQIVLFMMGNDLRTLPCIMR